MEWLRTDCFCFKEQMPSYVEEDHLMVMGHRDDNRVYYALLAIPGRPDDRREAYKALKEKYNSYLDAPVTTQPYTPMEYGLLVERTLGRYKAFVLDTFPDGE